MKNKIKTTVMNQIKIRHLLVFVIFTGGLMIFSSCNHDRNHPGWAYMPDMYYSEAYNAYSLNPVFDDSLTMQMPMDGTIPRGQMPYPYPPKSYPDQIKAGVEMINPVEATPENLARGKDQYDIFCMGCHGESGKGDGYLYTSKKFPIKPTSLVEPYVQGKPDGELHYIITYGSLSGLMGPHGYMISREDRWKIISYMRELAK